MPNFNLSKYKTDGFFDEMIDENTKSNPIMPCLQKD